MGKCLRPRVHSEAGPQKCWSDHRPPTAGTRPLPAHWALAGLDITSPGLHVKAPVRPKRLLSVLSENRAPRWGAAVGSAEGGLGESVNLVRLGEVSPNRPECAVESL